MYARACAYFYVCILKKKFQVTRNYKEMTVF